MAGLLVRVQAADGALFDLTVAGPVVAPVPDATNTGYGDSDLRPYAGEFGPIVNGRITLTTPGVHIERYRIPAWLDLRAADISIVGNLVEPAAAPSVSAGVINPTVAGVKRLHIERNTFKPQAQAVSPVWTGVLGHDYTAIGNDVSWCVDGFGVFNTSDVGGDVAVTIQDNYVHDHSWFTAGTPGESHSDGSHCDSLQIQNGRNITVVNNNFQSFVDPEIGAKVPHSTNSAVQVTGNVGDLTFLGGLFDGGVYTINVGPGTYPAFGAFSYLRFGRRQVPDVARPVKTMSVPNLATCSIVGAMWDDTRLPAPVSRY